MISSEESTIKYNMYLVAKQSVSVTPIKLKACKYTYMLKIYDHQMTHELQIYQILFHISVKLWLSHHKL